MLQAQHACSMEPCSYSIPPKTAEMAAIPAAVLLVLAVSPPFAGTAPARVAAAFPALLENAKAIGRPQFVPMCRRWQLSPSWRCPPPADPTHGALQRWGVPLRHARR